MADLHISIVEGESHRILTSYYRPKPGGFCRRYFRAIDALLNVGCEVHYLAVEPFPIQSENLHFHRFFWPAGRSDSAAFWIWFHIVAPWVLLYLGFRYRISRLFVFGHTYGLLMQPLRRVRQLPLSVFLRADAIRNHEISGRPRWVVRLDSFLERLGLAKARVFCVSKALSEAVMARHRNITIESMDVLRNDVPAEIRGGTGSRDGPVHFGLVGILEERKNLLMPILCMKDVPEEQATLHVFGTGPLESQLRAICAQDGLNARVSFEGWVPSSEIWSRVDVLLMPSRHEGAPNAVLEALAGGIPVLASDIDEHREILPETSLLGVDKREEWCSFIRRICAAPEQILGALRASQVEAAQALMFDWDSRLREGILR